MDVAKNNTSFIDTHVFVQLLKLNESSRFMGSSCFPRGDMRRKGHSRGISVLLETVESTLTRYLLSFVGRLEGRCSHFFVCAVLYV